MTIVFDESRCSACGACAVACLDQNCDDPGEERTSFRRVWAEETQTAMIWHSDGCRHCRLARCMEVCPAEAIVRDPATGFVVIERDYCLGCRKCTLACPYGAVTMGKDRRAQKCDGCFLRVQAGLAPACVAICPYGALRLEE